MRQALTPAQAERIALGFARRTGWTAFWAPEDAQAFHGATVVPLPIRYIEEKRWTEHTSTDIQYLAGLEALSMSQTELPAPAPYSNAIHTTIAHLGDSVSCPVCAGQGKMSCAGCSGRGRIACQRCAKAPGRKPKCATCSGYSFANNPCRACNGIGYEIPCQECKGELHTVCVTCTGLGNGDCARCRGTGKAHKCRLLTKKYQAQRTVTWMPTIPKDVAQWLDGALPLEREQALSFEEEPPVRALAGRAASYAGYYHLGHYQRNLKAFFLEYNGAYLKINEQLARRIAGAYGLG